MSAPGRNGPSAARPSGNRDGFALALVVLMLFAIAMAGVTGYQVMSTEFLLATQNRDSQKALSVARAGLQRFLGEAVGQVGDSVSYAIGDGIATVRTRKVVEKDARNHLYYIESTGSVADVRTPTSPATRSVGTYGWHRIAPVPQKGALWVSGGTTTLRSAGVADGTDHDLSATCLGAGAKAGVVTGGSAGTGGGGTIVGGIVTYAGFDAVYDTVGIRWDILKNPSFPVDFDGNYPDFNSLPADSFPVVRFTGDHTTSLGVPGRGVLIVGGRLRFGATGFVWDGIVLAGELDDVNPSAHPAINGMLIAGLNGSNPSVRLRSGNYLYHSCNAWEAGRSLSYLEVVGDAVFEVNG